MGRGKRIGVTGTRVKILTGHPAIRPGPARSGRIRAGRCVAGQVGHGGRAGQWGNPDYQGKRLVSPSYGDNYPHRVIRG